MLHLVCAGCKFSRHKKYFRYDIQDCVKYVDQEDTGSVWIWQPIDGLGKGGLTNDIISYL